jgi:hypothetical protein
MERGDLELIDGSLSCHLLLTIYQGHNTRQRIKTWASV